MSRVSCFRLSGIAVCAVLVFLLSCVAGAQNWVAPSIQTIGSGNTVTANPTLPRPGTTPCTVVLFQNLDFSDFNPKSFSYTPPAGCPGPWAAVVLNTNWSVDAGRQFDRTAEIWVGGANVFFGTTPEPSHNVQRVWHTESNLTEYTQLFEAAQQGRVDLGNLVNQTYTSHIHGSAYVQFYPVAQGQNPPASANMVLPMSSDPTGGTVTLNTPSDQLSATFTLPTNVERAYLNVFLQGQQNDEFWYTCAPSDVAGELFSCPNTAFREGEVTVDGQPAGVAPIYPWIFTGGIDPYLWRPIPGVHTLNFEPYRIDLTPFASILSNGQQHTVAVSVYNADMYFSACAVLLLYQDVNSTQVTGSLTTNTIGQPDPMVTENIYTTQTAAGGPVSVTSTRGYTVEGLVNTSHGTVDTKIVQSIDFTNNQKYYVLLDGSVDDQTIDQTTTVSSSTTITSGGNITTETKQYSWPLNLGYGFTANADGSYNQYTHLTQGFTQSVLIQLNGNPTFSSSFSDAVGPRDNLFVDSSGNATPTLQSNTETYQYSNSNGACWNQTINAAGGVLTSVQGGSCEQGQRGITVAK